LYDFLPEPDPEKDEVLPLVSEKKLPPEDRTRVIFLDIDGVLLPAGETQMVIVDGEQVPVLPTIGEANFNSRALEALRTIYQETGASIVLSSEWRRTEELRIAIGIALRTRGLPQVRACTTTALKPRPELKNANEVIAFTERRAREIGEWLQRNPDVKAWVAVDDIDFKWADGVRAKGMPLIKCRSVRTDALKCLSEQDAAEAVRILRNPPTLTAEQEAVIEKRAKNRLEAAFPVLSKKKAAAAAATVEAEQGALPPRPPPRRMGFG